jgi:hypothetical protein
MAAIGAATLVLWAAEVAGFALGRLPVAGSAYLALATEFGEWFGVGNSKLCEVARPARFGRGEADLADIGAHRFAAGPLRRCRSRTLALLVAPVLAELDV